MVDCRGGGALIGNWESVDWHEGEFVDSMPASSEAWRVKPATSLRGNTKSRAIFLPSFDKLLNYPKKELDSHFEKMNLVTPAVRQ